VKVNQVLDGIVLGDFHASLAGSGGCDLLENIGVGLCGYVKAQEYNKKKR
jgi:hypothetical protein